MKILGLALYGPQAASTRYRLEQYRPWLEAEGMSLEIRSLLGDSYLKSTFSGAGFSAWNVARSYLRRCADLFQQGRYDAAVLHLELLPFLPGQIESKLIRIPFVYDFDDAWFLRYRHGRFQPLERFLGGKLGPVLGRAAAVLAGNDYLLDFAVRHNGNCHLIPTVVDTDRYRCEPRQTPEIFTVGWIGSPSTSVYLTLVVDALAEVAREFPVRLVVVGGRCPDIPGAEVVNLPWAEDTEIGLINTFDVGVMPLFDDAWAQGKCGFKLIQYMACGVPAVASPVGVNTTIVADGSGLLARNTAEWADAFRRLRQDPGLRQAIGQRGRQRVEANYALQVTGPKVVDVFRSVVARRA